MVEGWHGIVGFDLSGGESSAEKHDSNYSNVLRKEVKNNPGSKQIEDDAIPSVILAFPHESAKASDVQTIERDILVTEVVGGCDGNQCCHEEGRD